VSNLVFAVTTHRTTFHVRGPREPQRKEAESITLVTKSLCLSFLTTCRTINKEAQAIFNPRLARLRATPTRLIVGFDTVPAFSNIMCRLSTKLVGIHNLPLAQRHLAPWEQYEEAHLEKLALLNKAAAYTCLRDWDATSGGEYRSLEICFTMTSAGFTRSQPTRRTAAESVGAAVTCAASDYPTLPCTCSVTAKILDVVGPTPVELENEWMYEVSEFMKYLSKSARERFTLQNTLDEGQWQRDWAEGEEA